MIYSIITGHLNRIQQGYGKTRKTYKWEKLVKELFLDNKSYYFQGF